ncbi:ethanolamine utilization microcompartment protein EutL [Oceanobacillus sojae]|uniref:Microcompartment protein EutL n=1 Tax=Oceanobacillus sojae TaxID=582851 RepID=A0A511ZFU6_9BACI|nr:ethanolamine utilization microcompartment protein EutL [Oceanobacillus sojae]MCT1902515.1 ethanolamine utilization microcompartment protein EutL [Oceanobacillus sojae]GEN86333.1 microcompartment protein EutL [Oceanobacillus sojae]
MKDDALYAQVLGVKLISNVDAHLADELKLLPNQRSIGILTGDIDDVVYTALDEATKKADVEVVYAESMYAGADNATTKLTGEVIGILAGYNPEEVRSGLDAAISYIENDAYFVSANEDDSIPYFAHLVSRTGTFLSKQANITEGEAIAYLIAPPLEAIYALDMALKSADVRLAAFFGPPSETNFGGALLTGSQSACHAACEAFARAVNDVADNPKGY